MNKKEEDCIACGKKTTGEYDRRPCCLECYEGKELSEFLEKEEAECLKKMKKETQEDGQS